MTTLKKGANVTRKTKTTIQHRPLVVTMHAEFLELRRFGKRESLTAMRIHLPSCRDAPSRARSSRPTRSGTAEPSTGRHFMKATSSFYCLDCVCGQRLRSETRDLVCTACGREIRIEWPAEAETPASQDQTQETKGAAA